MPSRLGQVTISPDFIETEKVKMSRKRNLSQMKEQEKKLKKLMKQK